MRSTLRPTTIEDLERVRALLQQAFQVGADAPFIDPALMTWKYWSRRNDWTEPRSYVLERNGRIVAHAGIYPMTFAAPEITGVHLIDWASANDSPGAGLALLQKLAAMFDFIYSCGGSDMTRKVLPAFGFVECATQWRGARPLKPVQQIIAHQHRNWRQPARIVRNVAWALQRLWPRAGHEGWASEEVGHRDLSSSFETQKPERACFSPRGPAFFEYLARCPVVQPRFYRLHDKHRPRGHFAIGVVRGQARLAGVWLVDADAASWQAAFSLAPEAAKTADAAHEIIAAGTRGLSEQAAGLSGFQIIRTAPVYLLNRTGKLKLPAAFQFQLADNDALFLDEGTADYWT